MINKAPTDITPANLDVVVMPNGEVICHGKTIGWVDKLGRFLTPKSEGDERRTLNDIAARLDRLCESIEKGASWESAGHLRNRSVYAMRSMAREMTK